MGDSGITMGSKRNLVIVLGHGLRADTLGGSQCWPLQTPNFQKLIDRGIWLSATSACPADSGGMVSLLTGLHPRQHGYLQQGPAVVCSGWPSFLDEAGYHVVGVGCVGPLEPWLDHALLVEPVDATIAPGCAYMTAARAKGMEAVIRQQRQQRLRSGPFDPDRLVMDCEDDIDGFIAAKARLAVTRMPTDRPWALVVIFSGPGNDLPPPTLFEYVVDPRSVEDGFTPADFRNLDVLAELDYPRVLLQRLEPHRLGRIRADYLGRVSLIDYGVGRLMSAVSDRADADQTWAILTSDRGQLLGEHGLLGHRSFLAGAMNVPVMIAPPAPVDHKTYPQHISTVDVAATIAALGGCDLPQAVVGRSLLNVFAGKDAPSDWDRSACLSEFGSRLMIASDRYKAVFDTGTLEGVGLFDMLDDPHEQDNIIDQPVAANVLDALRRMLGDTLLPMRAMPGGGV